MSLGVHALLIILCNEERYICVFQMAGDSERIAWEVLDVESHFPREAGGSLELSNDTSFSLRIKNATGGNSGTYKCALGEQNGEHNLSSTVTIKVTGTVQRFDCPMLCVACQEDMSKKREYVSQLPKKQTRYEAHAHPHQCT
ncbi:hypothetical protein RLOC_00001046 [Lonchura striata]|uniref:Ig-like domain-containing protein n=1 Tax=Lonchura striata TaxID=40157 RepID=A0A218UWB9_9PASE|nr:hypothetical protein RLOC_00001046 [Lonchura striata domestica]